MGFWLFKTKKEKATLRVLDATKDNVSRIKALDLLEEEARAGDDEAIRTILKCFHITVKPDMQEQTITRYDDEREKSELINRLVSLSESDREIGKMVLRLLRKELETPPLMSPGRRDGIVYLIELLRELAQASCDEEAEADALVQTEMIRALAEYDPEETYRDPTRKVEMIRALERHPGQKSTSAILPFLKDVDETVRFRAVESLAVTGDDQIGEALAETALDDESLRVRTRAMEVMASLECGIKGFPRRKEIETNLPKTIMVDKKGVVKER
jgi:hypothetical protein